MSDNISIIQEVYAAFGRGDLPALLDRVEDEPDWCQDLPADLAGAKAVPFLRHLSTKADVAETYFGNVVASMEFHSFVPTRFFADGADVVVLLELDVTVRATGRRIQFGEVHHFTLSDAGRIARYRNYLDTAGLVDAFGG